MSTGTAIYTYAHRAQKSLGLTGCSPPTASYTPATWFTPPASDQVVREFVFSPDGEKYAYILAGCVRVGRHGEDAETELEDTTGIVEIHFSPRGRWLSTWERPKKQDDPNAVHKNLRIWSLTSFKQIFSTAQRTLGDLKEWDIQYTDDETYAIRLVPGGSGEIQVFKPGEEKFEMVGKSKVEGASGVYLSPGKNPSVGVFVKERKGAPASFKLFSLPSLITAADSPLPITQKTFYKADRSTIKWNRLGTSVLLLTQTDVDNSNKSYYGETGLYLLSAMNGSASFDGRLTLDREGPIHDFAWSPSSKEFGVVYGYMPAKTTLFSTRLKPLFEWSPSPSNFISFSPDARWVIVAGFGNLAGGISVYERRDPGKLVTKIMAPNTTSCEWSGDAKFLMTSTFSPRLRVDNMIKIWHISTGSLVHVHEIDELYWASFRPCALAEIPSLPVGSPANEAPPPPSPLAISYLARSKTANSSSSMSSLTPSSSSSSNTPTKYRPPGARGTATPTIYKREDEGGYARVPGSGGSGPGTPNGRRARSPDRRGVPGSASYSNANGGGGGGEVNGSGKGGKGKKKGTKDKGEKAPKKEAEPETPPPPAAPIDNGAQGELDAVQKKTRNLTKKLKAIEELKARHAKGDKLEATQIRKMEGEAEIRKELDKLGVTETG